MSAAQSIPTWDNFIKQLIHALEPYGLDQQERLFSATVLDRGSQELSKGQAIVATDGVLGTFWPHSESREGMNPKSVKSLKASDGREFAVQAFAECSCEYGSRHFHFDSLPISPWQMDAALPMIQARVITTNGQPTIATFDSRDTGEEVRLTLDRGQAPDKPPVYLSVPRSTLTDASGRAVPTTGSLPPLCHYGGPPIVLEKYLSLPRWRWGFVLDY